MDVSFPRKEKKWESFSDPTVDGTRESRGNIRVLTSFKSRIAQTRTFARILRSCCSPTMPPRVDADDGADDVSHVAADRSAVHDGVDVVSNDGNEADGDIRISIISAINCNIIHSVMNASRSINSKMIRVIRASINIISSMIVNPSTDAPTFESLLTRVSERRQPWARANVGGVCQKIGEYLYTRRTPDLHAVP